VEATVTSETAIEGEAEYDEKRWEARWLELLARIGRDDSSDWGISNDGVSATINWSRMCRTCERGTKEQKAAGV